MNDLEWAVTAWARSRDPRIGDLADVLTEPRPAIKASRKAADLTAWKNLEAQGDPADFPALVAAARGGGQDDVIRQVQKLAQRNDPRFGAGMLKLLEDPPYAGVQSRGMLEKIFAAMRATRDSRLPAACRELAGRYLSIVESGTGGWIVAELQAIATELDVAKAMKLTAAEAKRCAALEKTHHSALAELGDKRAKLAGAKQSIDALLAAVYAAPDDDAPRLILADALLEQGNERGELIQLQIARARGTQTPEQAIREQALLRARGAEFAQPLANAGECTLVRGFPESIELYRTAKKTFGDPAWATIREVTGIGNVAQKDALALLDQLPNVRSIQTLDPKLMRILTTRPRPWTKLGVVQASTLTPEMFAALPELREVDAVFEAAAPPALFEHTELEQLSMRGRSVDLGAVLLPRTLRRASFTSTDVVPELLAGLELEQLELNIRNVPAGLFANAKTLRELELHVDELEPDALLGLGALESLTVSSKTTHRGCFAGLSNVRKLRITWDGDGKLVAAIPTLPPLVELELERTLHYSAATSLAGLRIESLRSSLPFDLLPSLPNVRYVAVREPDKLDVTAKVFANLPAIERLEIALHWKLKPSTNPRPELWARFAADLSASRVREVGFDKLVTLSRDGDGRLSRMRIGLDDESVLPTVSVIARAFGPVTLENSDRADLLAAVAAKHPPVPLLDSVDDAL